MENSIYPILIGRDMTQAQLADMVGVKREYINRIISGKITPRVPLGMRIARALDLKVEDCFDYPQSHRMECSTSQEMTL